MKITLIQGSLNAGSKTSIVVEAMKALLEAKGAEVLLVDLRDLDMPFCDGRKLEAYPAELQELYKKIEATDGAIFGMPVYCYSVSGALKNFIDIFSSAFTKKPFGIMANAGSPVSYLASNDLMKILAFECQCVPIMPVVLSSGGDFEDGAITSEKVHQKIEALAERMMGL